MSRLVRCVVSAAVLTVCGCTQPVVGRGTHATESAGPPATTGTPATGTPATGTPTPTPRRLDPAKVAREVNIRAGDLPAGWREIPGSRSGTDSLSWLVVCARDSGVSPGTLSGAETPDFSTTGRATASQVGTATGVFPDETAATRFVALLRSRTVGQCVSAEAMRTASFSFRTVPAFVPVGVHVPTVADGAGLQATATLTDGRPITYQFLAMRNGQIVTMLDTGWLARKPDPRLLATVASHVGTRQRAE